MNTFVVCGRTFSSKSPLIIAELGTSHGAELNRAKELIHAAAESGALCVKTQIVFADEILHPNTGTVELPGGPTPLYEVFKRLEMPFEFFAECSRYAKEKGVLFLASAFGYKSAAILRALNTGFVKIASPELNWLSFLKEFNSWGLPVLLSCGVSKLRDIEAALETLCAVPVCLLHCVTAYPAPAAEYNLSLLPHLNGIFGVPVGVSDHSIESSIVPVLALSQGACVIEKHFCISRSGDGLDDPIAQSAPEFAALCRDLNSVSALSPQEIIDAAISSYGKALVSACLGDGIKRLSKSEAENYSRTNRSIHALGTIKKGMRIEANSIAVLRTEKKLRPGLPPEFFEQIIGSRASAEIPAGEGVRLEDLL
ncbi:MAG: N-acetylneuraminate synthase family protein [Spirochaetaceae bacterium]|jgi:sialic acid synthase SpsE|nr:N-acetylneuraminate synthase family protein [Spirochaetaceae bacterium]